MRSLICLGLSLLSAAGAHAATINADGTTCTLPDAIVAANTDTATGGCPQGDTGADTIVLDADVTLTAVDATSTLHDGLGAGLPDVTDDLTLAAGLGNVIQRDPTFTCDAATADPVFRFLNLEAGNLTLEGLRFENGCAVADTLEGGGIWAEDNTRLTLDGVTVTDFGGFSTNGSLRGGFIYTDGEDLTLSDSRFESIDIEAIGASLDGGVIYTFSSSSTSSMTHTVFSDIRVTTDGGIDGGVINFRADTVMADSVFEDITLDNGNANLQGGALYSGNSSISNLERTTFRRFVIESDAGIQGGAIYTTNDELILSDVVFSDFDMAALEDCEGGALNTTENGPFQGLVVEQITCTSGTDVKGAAFQFRNSAEPVIRDCVFRDNEGLFGGNGSGGAIFAESAMFGTPELDIDRCAFINNRLTPAASAVNGNALGGAVSAARISSMRNVTFSGNIAEAGDGMEAVADGGSAFGGALHLQEDVFTSSISNVTLTGNQAMAGTGADGFADGSADGGGLYVAATHTAEIIGSVLSGNTVTGGNGVTVDDDCDSAGTLTSLGYNVTQNPDAACDFSSFGDVTGLDPNLYPVDDYGCDTALPDGTCVPAAAVDQTSWAVDWSSCAEAGIFDDARGLARRQDISGVPNLPPDACDAGAFEARDSDGDGVTDVPDLCPDNPDSDQTDSDGDQVGDACDACAGDDASGDSDADQVCDDSDVCPGFDDGSDADVDGVPDGCDVCQGDDASGDSDGDGVCDESDASVGDRVWLDDGDGIQDGGEGGVAGVTVNLYSSDHVLQDSTVTNIDGLYGFSPGPGDFYLEFVLPSDMAYAPRDQGMDDSTDSDVNAQSGTTSVFTLAAGDGNPSLDAGFEPAIIGNRVWLDADGDGVQQDDENGLEGVTVRLLDASGAEVAVTETGEGGVYGFLGVPTNEYRIEVTAPAGYDFTRPDAEAGDLVDSDVDPETGLTPLFSYQAASASQGWDAGLVIPAIFTDGFETGDLSAWSEDVP